MGDRQLLMKVRCLAGGEVYLCLFILSLVDKNKVYVICCCCLTSCLA